MKTNNYIPVGSNVICSHNNKTVIGKTISDAELITFCEFGSYQGFYQYNVKLNNGSVIQCSSESISIAPKITQRLNNLFKLKNLLNVNLCSI